MKRLVVVSLVLVALGLVTHPSPLLAQTAAQEIPFDSVPNFLKMPPGLYPGENAGVAVNSQGHIFVYTRSGAPGHIIAPQSAQLFEFAPLVPVADENQVDMQTGSARNLRERSDQDVVASHPCQATDTSKDERRGRYLESCP